MHPLKKIIAIVIFLLSTSSYGKKPPEFRKFALNIIGVVCSSKDILGDKIIINQLNDKKWHYHAYQHDFVGNIHKAPMEGPRVTEAGLKLCRLFCKKVKAVN